MPTFFASPFTWLRSSRAGQVVLLGVGLLVTYWGYFLWQVVGAVVHFGAFGSGEGHRDQGFAVAASCALLHLGVVSGLAWHRVLYPSGWVWALNALLVIALFVHHVFHPWQRSPLDPSYQRYSFVQGNQRYELTLERPDHVFDLSEVTPRPNGRTTSLLMGDYHVRHDTIFFQAWAGSWQGFLYQRTLVGFKGSSQPIRLTREADIIPWSLR